MISLFDHNELEYAARAILAGLTNRCMISLAESLDIMTFHVYMRQGRFTGGQLDKSGKFSVSVSLDKLDPVINRICGWQSGFNIDKVKEAGLDLVEPEIIHTPGIRQYPLTVECRVLYAQRQDLSLIPEDIRERAYPQDVDGTYPMANRDAHTMYVGEIVDVYIIRK